MKINKKSILISSVILVSPVILEKNEHIHEDKNDSTDVRVIRFSPILHTATSTTSTSTFQWDWTPSPINLDLESN